MSATPPTPRSRAQYASALVGLPGFAHSSASPSSPAWTSAKASSCRRSRATSAKDTPLN